MAEYLAAIAQYFKKAWYNLIMKLKKISKKAVEKFQKKHQEKLRGREKNRQHHEKLWYNNCINKKGLKWLSRGIANAYILAAINGYR